MSARIVCIILAIIVCLVLLWLVFLFTKRKRKVREDAEKEGQGITGQEEKKRRRKKTIPPTPPTPSCCPQNYRKYTVRSLPVRTAVQT